VELLQRPARRRAVVRRLPRAAHVPAVPEDGRRADTAAVLAAGDRPEGLDWASLLERDGDALEVHYRHLLTELGRKPGMLGVVFRKAQNRIQDPAKLRRLIVELIDRRAG